MRATRVAAFPPQPISPASLLGWLTAADTRPGIVILLFLFRYFLSAASYSRSTAFLYSSIRGSTCCSPVIFSPGLIFGRGCAVVHPARSLDQRRQSDRRPLRAISSWKIPRFCGSANDNQILVYPLRSVAIGVSIGSVGIRKVVSRTPRIARSTQGIERWRSRGIGARRYDTLVFHHRTPRMQVR